MHADGCGSCRRETGYAGNREERVAIRRSRGVGYRHACRKIGQDKLNRTGDGLRTCIGDGERCGERLRHAAEHKARAGDGDIGD